MRLHVRVLCAWSLVGTILLTAQAAVAGDPPPLAHNPLPPGYFSIDIPSPTNTPPLSADSVLTKPGPSVAIPNVGLGLGRPGDEVDEISDLRNIPAPAATFALLFSVDRASVGAVPPDPIAIGAGFPYNAQQQAANHQAAGDIFMTTGLFNRLGALPFRASNNNTLVINQGDAGGVDHDLSPAVAPDVVVAGPIDELDAFAYPEGTPSLDLNNRILFTLDRESPSLSILPGTGSGADIYVDFAPLAPGGENLYASPAMLGLQFMDDIDGLLVFDDGNGFFNPAQDQVLFSLARGSPSLQLLGLSAADLLTNSPSGGFVVYAQAAQLGLGPLDNLDALDLLYGTDIDLMIQQRAIFPEPATGLLLAGLSLAGRVRRRRQRNR